LVPFSQHLKPKKPSRFPQSRANAVAPAKNDPLLDLWCKKYDF